MDTGDRDTKDSETDTRDNEIDTKDNERDNRESECAINDSDRDKDTKIV